MTIIAENNRLNGVYVAGERRDTFSGSQACATIPTYSYWTVVLCHDVYTYCAVILCNKS